jgi:putative hydrolase of HD superfamily
MKAFASQVIQRNQKIDAGAPDLWAFASDLIDQAVDRGLLAPDDPN